MIEVFFVVLDVVLYGGIEFFKIILGHAPEHKLNG